MTPPVLPPARVPVLSELSRQTDNPIRIIWQPDGPEGRGPALYENAPRVALFRSSRRCFATVASWHRHETLRQAPHEAATRARPRQAADASGKALARSGVRVTEREAKAVLACCGVPVIGERLAHDVDQAVAAAQDFGCPVALKLESPEIAHKTEAGVIRLDLRDAAAVRKAYAEILAAVELVTPRPRINGVLVQPMAPKGVELVIGARVDRQFGPLIVVGSGGGLVELLRDSVVAAAAGSVVRGRARPSTPGPDTRNFAKPPQPPRLTVAIAEIEASPKPVVAAIEGVALGGGLEVALGCHFRIGTPRTQVGLPEVKIGIVPGAGGIERPTRLIRLEPALQMMVSGGPVRAGQARQRGSIDAN